MPPSPSEPVTDRDHRRLEDRVDRLEATLLHVVSTVACGLLVVGLILPYVSIEGEWVTYEPSLLSFPVTQAETEADESLVEVGVVYLALVAAAIAALVALGACAHRGGGRGLQIGAAVCGWLVLLSAVCAAILAMVGAGSEDDWQVGPGIWLYAAGAIVAFAVLATQRGRDFWLAERRGHVGVR